MTRLLRSLIVLIVLIVLLIPIPSAAAGGPDLGLRLGYTHDSNLDQLHFGGHVTVYKLSPNVRITPSFEIGIGDGTLLALNGDVFYDFTELATKRWGYYAGGGPLLSRFSRSRRSSTDFALNLAAGVTRELKPSRTIFAEVRLGLEDAPILKITAGVNFF